MRNPFKRNWNVLGGKLKKTKTDEPERKHFQLGIEVANYVPVPYMYTTDYADFVNHAVDKFAGVMKKAKPDDMNMEMFDSFIETNVNSMRAFVDVQAVRHLDLLDHHESVLAGEIHRLQGFTDQLSEDLHKLFTRKNDLLRQVGLPEEAPALPDAPADPADEQADTFEEEPTEATKEEPEADIEMMEEE